MIQIKCELHIILFLTLQCISYNILKGLSLFVKKKYIYYALTNKLTDRYTKNKRLIDEGWALEQRGI
jgi:hypothetical protein